jgi:hypothetical protein
MYTKTNFCRTAFCLMLLVAVFTSCKKDDKKATEISMANIAGTYKFTLMTYQYNNDPVENILQDLDACDKDNTVTFKVNSTYSYVDIGLVCSPSSAHDGTWAVPSTTTFELDGESMTIDSFDGNNLNLTNIYTSQGSTETYHYTFTRQ